MGWLDRLSGRSRRRASSADPVAVALADAAATGSLRILIEGEQPALTELPDWIGVDEDDEMDGFNTLVELDDEIHFYCDPADGLDLALGEQPGIREAFAEDREVIYLRTRLHLDDVAAAVVRAVVDVNRNPREYVAPPGEVTDEQAREVANAVATLATAAGYSRREDGRYFYRACDHGIVQVLSVLRGLGVRGDGTSLHDKIHVHYGVCIPEAQYRPLPDDPARVAPGDATLSSSVYVLPTPTAVAEVLETMVLPWLAATAGRDALAAWVIEDPEQIDPPMRRPLLARTFTEWSHPEAARRILEHLDRDWPSLAQEAEARAAREALDRG